jgi:carbonic anhydrase
MGLLHEIIEHNAHWVAERNRPVDKRPQKKVVIFTCMDTRLIEFLEPALGLRRGDAQTIKNAGNTLLDPGGGVVRSLVVAIHALGCEEIFVIGHKDCGMAQLDGQKLRANMLESGVPEEAINALRPSLQEWLGGFHNPMGNVTHVVDLLRKNALIPKSVPVHGAIFDPATGALSVLVDGYGNSTRPSAIP